jgi:hypothetical protein
MRASLLQWRGRAGFTPDFRMALFVYVAYSLHADVRAVNLRTLKCIADSASTPSATARMRARFRSTPPARARPTWLGCGSDDGRSWAAVVGTRAARRLDIVVDGVPTGRRFDWAELSAALGQRPERQLANQAERIIRAWLEAELRLRVR